MRTIFTVVVEFHEFKGQFFVERWLSRHPLSRLSEDVIAYLEQLTLKKSSKLASVQIVDFQRV